MATGQARRALSAAGALPIAAHKAQILRALAAHPVVVVAGETGSGKSTQLPQYCLESGRGRTGAIAHTQPRRLAARALAARIAAELGQTVGATVGYRVRFADEVTDGTRHVLMTDGLLLAQIARDPDLRRYDTIIIDEAHERSLNIDLLFGVAKRLLQRREELRVIVTSASLDVERIAGFFDAAPVITVSGRSHPVEVRYRSASDQAEEADLPGMVLDALQEILAEPGAIGSADTLVFLPGEREIRDVGELLSRECAGQIEILPLYARLPWETQRSIFERGERRRVILCTNVAETSLTVPGIGSVIDSGLARVSRYSAGSRLQRLQIEPVSQASANQRKGRCGRIGPGLCIRLYSQAEFDARPPFTEPEVLRTNLSALLLRLSADALGAVEDFPFIDPPDRRALNDGYRTLLELEAIDARRAITARGKAMARLPVDPRLARAVLESKRFRCAGELFTIAAALSVPDPRLQAEDTAEETERASDPRSDFMSMLKLWRAYRLARKRPRRELRQWCRARRLSLIRLCEWENVHGQLADRAREIGIADSLRPAGYTAVHRALLAGFCTQIGVHDQEGVYHGIRGTRFSIFPASPLRRRRPRWIMAANIVATSRVFARTVAQVEPSWIESAARHLLAREYLAADWSESAEQVIAQERVSLFGLTLSSGRIVNYGPIAPTEARAIFAREAVVFGRMSRRPAWLRDNDEIVAQAARIEDRLRMRGLAASAETMIEFYEQLLPRQISSADALERWTSRLAGSQLAECRLPESRVWAQRPDAGALAAYPEKVQLRGEEVEVRYRFDPNAPDDGATLLVPALALPRLARADIDRAVPGLALPRVEALLRSLPKSLRKNLIPIARHAREFIEQMPDCALSAADLAPWLQQRFGIPGAELQFAPDAVPAPLMPTIAVVHQAREIARGKQLPALRKLTEPLAAAQLARIAHEHFPAPWRRFEAAELPEAFAPAGAHRAHGATAGLEFADGAVRVGLFWDRAEAQRSHRHACVRLARIVLGAQARQLAASLSQATPLLLAASPYARAAELADALLQQAFERALLGGGVAPRSGPQFDEAVRRAQPQLAALWEAALAQMAGSFAEANRIRGLIRSAALRAPAALGADAELHLKTLLAPGSWIDASGHWLNQIPRYLRAARLYWQRMQAGGREGRAQPADAQRWRDAFEPIRGEYAQRRLWSAEVEDFPWWIEEYRCSLGAQELKTCIPISAQRLQQRLQALRAALDR